MSFGPITPLDYVWDYLRNPIKSGIHLHTFFISGKLTPEINSGTRTCIHSIH